MVLGWLSGCGVGLALSADVPHSATGSITSSRASTFPLLVLLSTKSCIGLLAISLLNAYGMNTSMILHKKVQYGHQVALHNLLITTWTGIHSLAFIVGT